MRGYLMSSDSLEWSPHVRLRYRMMVSASSTRRSGCQSWAIGEWSGSFLYRKRSMDEFAVVVAVVLVVALAVVLAEDGSGRPWMWLRKYSMARSV